MNRLDKTESAGFFLYFRFSLFLKDPFSILFDTQHYKASSGSSLRTMKDLRTTTPDLTRLRTVLCLEG